MDDDLLNEEVNNETNTHNNSRYESKQEEKTDDVIITNEELGVDDENTCVLRWQDIRLEVPDPKDKTKTKTILNGISGYANKGELMGIIGASGGGKTSLLSMISGRITSVESLQSANCEMNGMIQLNGYSGDCSQEWTFQYLRDGVAYVLQEDLLIGTEKTREAIEVSGLLRIKDESRENKLLKVRQIMEDLDLIKVQDTFIGDAHIRGISGGEKKRVSIAIELVTDPDVLLLDEPTSGLDSAIAYETVNLLSQLAKKNKCIVASLHQPSSEIFALLDRVMILAKGEVIYEGYIKDELPNYLLSIGYECPEYSNIADYVLQQVHLDPDKFIKSWKQHLKESDDNLSLLKRQLTSELREEFSKRKYYMAPLSIQIPILFKRSCITLLRNKTATMVRIGQAIFTGLLQGFLWFRLKSLNKFNSDSNKAITNAQDRFGGIFYAVAFAAMNSIMTSNLVFPSIRLVFQKERSANWYNTYLWVLCKTLLDIPVTFFVVIPFVLLIKYMCNFRASYEEILLAVVLVALVADSIGFLLGVVAKRADIAVQLTPITIIPLMLFSNFFVSTSNIPVWLRWIKWIDPFYYGTELFSLKEFHGVKPAGNDILDRYNMKISNYKRDVFAMIGLFFAYRIIGVLTLFYKNGL